MDTRDPPEEPQVPAHVSYSSLDSWLQCGKRHQLQRVMGLREDPSWWSIGGGALHQASEALDRERFKETGR